MNNIVRARRLAWIRSVLERGWRFPALATWILVGLFLAPPPLAAQPTRQRSSFGSGIDVVMLVDVSGSMWLKRGWAPGATNGGPIGNDPDRLRWDAVKLVLDLLIDQDRLLVLPFNHECPARLSNTLQAMPGALPREFAELSGSTGDEIRQIRERLRARLTTFIHVAQGPATPTEFNGDEGGTALLASLRHARAELNKVRVPGRKTVIILLTDGEESTGEKLDEVDTEDERLVADDTWRADPSLRELGDGESPVYTLALGADLSPRGRRFLHELARFSGGSDFEIRDNQRLVTELQDLVWRLRACFVLLNPFQVVKPGTVSSGQLTGAIDLGVIVSDVPNVSPDFPARIALPPDLSLRDRRVAWAPRPEPERRWIVPWNGPAPGEVNLSGKSIAPSNSQPARPSGYSYYYWDFRSGGKVTAAMAAQLASQELRLDFSASPSDGRHIEGRFVKRLDVEFDVELPKRRFYRNEPIKVGVAMRNPRGGATGLRDLNIAAVVRLLHRDKSATDVQVRLQREGDRFLTTEDAPLTAENLPPSGADVDDYYLEVEIRSRSTSADGSTQVFRSLLPLRIIEIENTIPLRAAPANLTLDRDQGELKIPIETQFPWSGKLRLQAILGPTPKLTQAAKALDARFFDSDDLRRGAVELRAGSAVLAMRLKSVEGKFPETGVYDPGQLRFVAADPQMPLRITTWDAIYPDENRFHHDVPLRLRVGTIEMRLEPSVPARLETGPRAAMAEHRFQLHLARKDQQPDADSAVELSLKKVSDSADAVVFAPEELWIQPVGNGPAVRERRQSIPLAQFGEPLVIYFAPRPAMHARPEALIGRHVYGLEVSGKRYDTLNVAVLLEVLGPEIEAEWRSDKSTPEVAPGGMWTQELRTRMRWLPGGRLPANLEPKSPLPFAFELVKESVPYRGGETPLVLASAEANEEGPWVSRQVTFEWPRTSKRYGHYRGELRVVSPGAPAVTLPVRAAVNSLTVFGLQIPDQKRKLFEAAAWQAFPEGQPTEQVEVRQWLGAAAKHTLVIRNELDSQLHPEHLKIEWQGFKFADGTGPFLVRDGTPVDQPPRDFVPTPQCRVRRGAVPGQLLVDLDFPRIVQATLGAPYVADAKVSYGDSDNQVSPQSSVFRLTVFFLDPKRVLNTTRQESQP